MLSTLVLAVIAISVIQANSVNVWSAFPGQMVQISAKGEHLWAIDRAGYVHKWNGTLWTKIGSNPYGQIAACADGSAWARGKDEYDYAYRLNNTGDGFEKVAGDMLISQINAFYKDLAIAVTPKGEVYLWQASGWSQIGHDAKWAAIGEGDERWMIGKNGSIYRWQDHKWRGVPSLTYWSRTIDVQNEHRVVVFDYIGNVYTWQDPDWLVVEGLRAESATINETRIIAIPKEVVHIWTADVKSCLDIMPVKQDTHFLGCSVTIKSSDGTTAEKCCIKCKKVPTGGGCYFRDNECNVCNGEVKDEQPMSGSVMFSPPLKP